MENEATIRLAIFLGLFALIAVFEHIVPRRPRPKLKRRWITNWAIVVVDTLALRAFAILLPILAVTAAADATVRGWGALNLINWPLWIEIILAIVILDFMVWLHHVINHKVPLFWRYHRVHHADVEMDVTTAIRFHPIEIFLSMFLKIGVVYVLGAPVLAVIIFEILLNGSAMFNHSNIRLPLGLDRQLRRFMVTPDMHRIHHSARQPETDSNYGFALSVWDRWFGTYTEDPKDGHDAMTVGLEWQDERPTKLGWSLALPFFRR
ncbi:MAG: sterol desaturase family protein [Pseudomonadota bacterium]